MNFYYLEHRISKILRSDKTTQQVNTFKDDDCSLSYEGERDIDGKISNSLKAIRLMNITFKPLKFQKYTRIKVCNTLRFDMAVDAGQ
jgi:hypothetical protein